MTKTQRVTRSTVFRRSLQCEPRAAPAEERARSFRQYQRDAYDGFLALFDSVDDFDALARECIPTVPAASDPDSGRKRSRSITARTHEPRTGRGHGRSSTATATASGHTRR